MIHLLNVIPWRYSTPLFTQIRPKIWAVRAVIYLCPYRIYGCHWAALHETQACTITLCKELLREFTDIRETVLIPDARSWTNGSVLNARRSFIVTLKKTSKVTRILRIIVQTTNMLAVIKAGKPEWPL